MKTYRVSVVVSVQFRGPVKGSEHEGSHGYFYTSHIDL
jgi:hypothetical protein